MKTPECRPFWLVWNPSGGRPMFRHSTEEDAKTEAIRLARLHPSCSFIVLQSVVQIRILDVVETDLRPQAEEEPPF